MWRSFGIAWSLTVPCDMHAQQTHRSCLIGRSTGRKFRAPNGLSMPKDAELSTTHAQVRRLVDASCAR